MTEDLARLRELNAKANRTPEEDVELSRLAHSAGWVPLSDVLNVISHLPYGGGRLVIGKKRTEPKINNQPNNK